MSRDWTPKEWDIVHQQDPGLRNHFNNLVLIDSEGNEVPLISKEQKEQFEQFPKLNLVGNSFLNMCSNEGVLNSNIGNKVVRMIENILLGTNYGSNFKEFEEKVNLWYNGELDPGYYMDNNNEALIEETKNIMKNWNKLNEEE